MKQWKTHLALSALTGAALLGACGKNKLTCGDGTSESDGKCVADFVPDDGMGGESGDGDGMGGEPNVDPLDDPRFEGISPIRRSDAALVLQEFKGAIAAAAASSTSALVVWEPVEVYGVTYNIYVSTRDDNFSFGTPQFLGPEGADSALLTGLEEDEEHFIVIRPVIDGVELPVESVIVSVTLEDDDEAPSFVGASEVETVDGASVRVSWDKGSDNVTPDEVLRYYIYMGIESDEVNLLSAFHVSRPGATSATFQLPEPDEEYFFIVRVQDAAGHFDDNEAVVSGTSGPDIQAPVFSGCSSAAPRNASSIDVTWNPAVDDIASADQIVYNLYASTEPDGHNFSEPSATIVGGNSGFVPGLEADVTYYVVCRAADPSGNEEKNPRVQFATTKDDDVPPVFGGITSVENLGSESFDLTWNAATDNQSLPEDIVYRVFLSDTADGHDFDNDTPAAEVVGQNAVSVQDVDSRTDYFVVVLAYDDAANRSAANPATPVTTLVSLRADIEIPIFQNKCATTGCHSGDTPASGMNLSPGFSFLNIVNVTPTTTLGVSSGFDRVEPFQPSQSHLVERINSTEDGVRMPLSGDLLSAGEISTIEQWITEGALNN